MRKVQLPVLGGVRKVVTVPAAIQQAGTTISEFANQVITLAQLKAALGITTSKTSSGGTGSVSLVPGPGLYGGGVLVGAVPIGLLQSTPPVFWDESLLPDNFVGGSSSGTSGITFTDGTHTVAGATNLTVTGGTVGGSSPNATLTISGGSGSANITADTHPSTAAPNNDEFEFGSAIDTTGSRFSGATAWTWLTSSLTTAITSGSLVTTVTSSGNPFAVDQPVSGSTFTFGVKLSGLSAVSPSQIGYGLYFRNSASSNKAVVLSITQQSSGGPQIEIDLWNNLATGSFNSGPSATQASALTNGPFAGPCYLELAYDGTNYICSQSANGITYIKYFQQAVSTFLGGITHAGVYFLNSSGSTVSMAFDWFRKLA